MPEEKENKISFIKDIIGFTAIIMARIITIPLVLISLIFLTLIYKITRKEKIDDIINKLFIWVFCPPFIMSASIAFWIATILSIIKIG